MVKEKVTKRVRFSASQPPPARRPKQPLSSQPPMAADGDKSGGSQPSSSSGNSRALDVFNALPMTLPHMLPSAISAPAPNNQSLPPLKQSKDFFDPPPVPTSEPEDNACPSEIVKSPTTAHPKLLRAADFFDRPPEPRRLRPSDGVYWAPLYDMEGDKMGHGYRFPRHLVEAAGIRCTPAPSSSPPPPSPPALPRETASNPLPKIRLPARPTAIGATHPHPPGRSTVSASISRPTIRLPPRITASVPKASPNVPLDLTMDSLTISLPRPAAKEPDPQSNVDIDMTLESDGSSPPLSIMEKPASLPRSSSDVDIEMTDSTSIPIAAAPPVAETPDLRRLPAIEGDFVFNTNDLLATRQTLRSWRGGNRPEDWIVAREDLHAEHVDNDRALPSELQDPLFPSFMISPGDMHSLHVYLMARFDLPDYDDYVHFLALYRNTRATEAITARNRFIQLTEVSDTLWNARREVLERLTARHSA